MISTSDIIVGLKNLTTEVVVYSSYFHNSEEDVLKKSLETVKESIAKFNTLAGKFLNKKERIPIGAISIGQINSTVPSPFPEFYPAAKGSKIYLLPNNKEYAIIFPPRSGNCSYIKKYNKADPFITSLLKRRTKNNV